ncbi:hypothetical protein WMY93_017337 [Mugilogobius chulae]|uniref:Uncharacterized protein n=1 Tax=Mugilogobius chulae TaxID=88201 RepID=A0AAW0NSR3_9GOBI
MQKQRRERERESCLLAPFMRMHFHPAESHTHSLLAAVLSKHPGPLKKRGAPSGEKGAGLRKEKQSERGREREREGGRERSHPWKSAEQSGVLLLSRSSPLPDPAAENSGQPDRQSLERIKRKREREREGKLKKRRTQPVGKTALDPRLAVYSPLLLLLLLLLTPAVDQMYDQSHDPSRMLSHIRQLPGDWSPSWFAIIIPSTASVFADCALGLSLQGVSAPGEGEGAPRDAVLADPLRTWNHYTSLAGWLASPCRHPTEILLGGCGECVRTNAVSCSVIVSVSDSEHLAAQKLNLSSKRKKHQSSLLHAHEPSIYPTNFSGILQALPPPAPPCLLRAVSKVKDNPGMGKVKVMMRICPSLEATDSGSESQSFLKVDSRKKQVTLYDPASSPHSSSGHRRSATVAVPKIFAFDAVFTQDASQGHSLLVRFQQLASFKPAGNDLNPPELYVPSPFHRAAISITPSTPAEIRGKGHAPVYCA